MHSSISKFNNVVCWTFCSNTTTPQVRGSCHLHLFLRILMLHNYCFSNSNKLSYFDGTDSSHIWITFVALACWASTIIRKSSKEYYVGAFNSTGQGLSSKEPSLTTDGGRSLNTLKLLSNYFLYLRISIMHLINLIHANYTIILIHVRYVFIIVTCFSYFC